MNLYGWKRPRKEKRKKQIRIGIRAKQPNEIWHLDFSYFILPNKTKCFIQTVIDNYSRYVIAWQILESYDGSKTGFLLKTAIDKTFITKSGNLQLVVDGGSENKGPIVRRLEDLRHFKKFVAQLEISYSNSIVEAVFRSLKHNYLFHREINSITLLRKHSDFWFQEHNEIIPHCSFAGETPAERFKQKWSEKDEIRIFIGQREAIKLRIAENQKLFCEMCKT